MESKIQQLTDKILNEGVERGKEEAAKIIASANDESKDIIAKAQQQAEEIIAQANKQAESLKKNTCAELQMFADQTQNALKSEITNIMTKNTLDSVINSVVADKDFMNKFILKIAESWGKQEDIVISTEDAKALKALFAKEAKDLLAKGVSIEEVHGQKVLFTIQPADGSYKINFGEEEFKNYFKSFLRPQLLEMLF